MGGHSYESPKDLRAPSQEVRPHMPDQYVSNDGWALIWIDAILTSGMPYPVARRRTVEEFERLAGAKAELPHALLLRGPRGIGKFIFDTLLRGGAVALSPLGKERLIAVSAVVLQSLR